jgi:hypothetical protein
MLTELPAKLGQVDFLSLRSSSALQERRALRSSRTKRNSSSSSSQNFKVFWESRAHLWAKEFSMFAVSDSSIFFSCFWSRCFLVEFGRTELAEVVL